MGIYIKRMELPKSCPCKLVGVGYDLYCSFTSGIPSRMKEYIECCKKETKPNWCPLVEVPPHGRLGDLDALAAKCDSPHWCVWLSEIEDAPTVIEEDFL